MVLRFYHGSCYLQLLNWDIRFNPTIFYYRLSQLLDFCIWIFVSARNSPDKDVAVDPYCLDFTSFGDHRGFVFCGRSVRPEKSLGETSNPMIGSMDFNHETLDRNPIWLYHFTNLKKKKYIQQPKKKVPYTSTKVEVNQQNQPSSNFVAETSNLRHFLGGK